MGAADEYISTDDACGVLCVAVKRVVKPHLPDDFNVSLFTDSLIKKKDSEGIEFNTFKSPFP